MKYQTSDEIYDAENFATFEEIEYMIDSII